MLLRFTEIILILLAYKRWKEFCQNLSKVQIFHHYIIDAFRLLPASSHSKLGFQTLRLVLVKPATNIIFEEFPWFILNRYLSSFAAHESGCMQYSFFHKSRFIFETPLKCLSRKLLTSIIIIIIIVIVHLFTVGINRSRIISKKGVNWSQLKKRKNHMFI